MNRQIDITGLDKAELLTALWYGARNLIVIFSYATGRVEFLDMRQNAVEFLSRRNNYIDYYNGRSIKTDFSRDLVDPYFYDRESGQGEFARIVAILRNR